MFDAGNVNLSKLRESFSFLSTVSSNKSMFKSRDVCKADEAIELNGRVNHLARDKMILLKQTFEPPPEDKDQEDLGPPLVPDTLDDPGGENFEFEVPDPKKPAETTSPK